MTQLLFPATTTLIRRPGVEQATGETTMKDRQEHTELFYSAPDSALFDQVTIAHIRGCSPHLLERDRWEGKNIPFIKIGRAVRYRKSDVLAWLAQYQPQQSTSESKTQQA